MVMMEDDKLFHAPNDLRDCLISNEDDSQHPSIVNSVTNDEDDYDHGNMQQQQQQQQRQEAYYSYRRHHNQPYRCPQKQNYPTSQILPPPLPPPKNEEDDRRDEHNRVGRMEFPPQNGHHDTHAETPGGSAKPILHAGSYLIRYEHMMKVQQTEKMATLSHVQPMLEVLEKMIESFNVKKSSISSNIENCFAQYDDQADDLYDEDDDLLMDGSVLLSKEIRVADLRKVLAYIQTKDEGGREDDCPTLLQNIVVSSIDLDLIRMDSQMMLVLETICQPTPTSKDVEESDDQTSFISWAEMLQLYRVCVVGSQTLEILSSSPTIRERAKGRTLRMISLFDHDHYQPHNQQKHVGIQDTSDIQQISSKRFSGFDRRELSNIMNGAEEVAYSDAHHKSISLPERPNKGTGSFESPCGKSRNIKTLLKVVGLVLLGLMVLVHKSYDALSGISVSVGDSEQHDKAHNQGSLDLKPVELDTVLELSSPNPLRVATATKVLSTGTSKIGSLNKTMAAASPTTPQKEDLGFDAETTKSHLSLALPTRSNQDVADRMLSKVGGTAAILYLSLPLLSAGGISAPVTLLVTLGGLAGRWIGKWVATMKLRNQVEK